MPEEKWGKIAFALEARDVGPKVTKWPPVDTETAWVELLGHDRASLMNIPFYANGVSFLDELSVREGSDAPFLTMTGVARRSGNGTIRALLVRDEGRAEAEAALDAAKQLGCNYETTGNGVVAINIPSGVRSSDVLAALEPARRDGIIYIDIGFLPDG